MNKQNEQIIIFDIIEEFKKKEVAINKRQKNSTKR